MAIGRRVMKLKIGKLRNNQVSINKEIDMVKRTVAVDQQQASYSLFPNRSDASSEEVGSSGNVISRPPEQCFHECEAK